MQRSEIQICSANRVEGDLKVRLQVEKGVVTDAWSQGIMYRGIENILVGRGPLDGLVLTPRVCGICSTSHLKAAAKALDMICGKKVPDDGKRIRSAALMVEKIQNDIRHSFFMFTPDFTRPDYRSHPMFDEAVERYQPLKGSVYRQVIQVTKKVLEIIAILGGQWPHSSFMVPAGVVSLPNQNEIVQCIYLLERFREWYEKQVLGCRLDRWLAVKSLADLEIWLDESPAHGKGELGFFIRFARKAQLEKLGKGHGNFISFGALDMPEHTQVKPLGNGHTYFPAGFVSSTGEVQPLDEKNITEDISHAWFEGHENISRPMHGETRPYATGSEHQKYSWVKAPRYDGKPAETGPLAEMMSADIPLYVDLLRNSGANVFARQLARLARPALLIPVLHQWLKEISCHKKYFFEKYARIENGEGFGLVDAPRGGLGHWVRIVNERIEKYQIITPTCWNASPRDQKGFRGAWEEALVGTEIGKTDHHTAVEHVIRSFDPCMVCAVHVVDLS